MSSTTADSERSADHLPSHNWGWFALRGVLLLVLGAMSLLFPFSALFAAVFAAYCFADGIFALVSGLRGARRHQERWWALVISGLLGIAVGVVFFLFPLLGTLTYTVLMICLIAGWAVASGVLQIAAAWRLRRAIKGEWLLILVGALSVLLGLALVAMLFAAPGPTLLSLSWLIGVWALIGGVAMLVLAFRLRGHKAEAAKISSHSADPAL
jgi:uncharacterized membrane protein HdeD (DUF308 family)